MPNTRSHSPVRAKAEKDANYELSNLLAEFLRSGIPTLQGFNCADIPEEAFSYLLWGQNPKNLVDYLESKKLTPYEESRQAAIRELVYTEANYIRHLMTIVEVYIAAAHALQDNGKLLDVDTSKLFSNIPDVLNASLYFWNMTIYPMVASAVENKTPFNSDLMLPGFRRIRETLQPCEKYVCEQKKAVDYLRLLSNNADFMTYLKWCYSHHSSQRLLLNDLLVKPMQRLTKYAIIVRQIIAFTNTEPERTNLTSIDEYAKDYVLNVNRAIKYHEDLEKIEELEQNIESYEVDFKDEELEKFFRMFANLNLKAPMINCLPHFNRILIHQSDLRFKDAGKEIEVRAFLLTDMILICKKQPKSIQPFKMIRPKYMLDKLFSYPKYRLLKENPLALLYVAVDDFGTAHNGFSVVEASKELASLKVGEDSLWEQKVREAKMTYDLSVLVSKNPSLDLSEVEMDSSSEGYGVTTIFKTKSKPNVNKTAEDIIIEQNARENVAMMMNRGVGASTEYDYSLGSLTDSFEGEMSSTSGMRTPGWHGRRYPMHRNSTGSSRNSRLSSFQKSISAASHDEPPAVFNKLQSFFKVGTSVEHQIPPQKPDDIGPSITVKVVSESDAETGVPIPQPPLVILEHSSPHKVSSSRSISTSSPNTLRVQPQSGVLALVHSLPDLSLEPLVQKQMPSPTPKSASEKLYKSHQELLQKNRLSASHQQQFLKPDNRGTSYPPPCPTRASLKRSLAFSYSFKNPPLYKMGHVNSQSQLQSDAGPSTSQASKNEKSPVVCSPPAPSPVAEKAEKKAKQVSARQKDSGRSTSPSPGPSKSKSDKEEKSD